MLTISLICAHAELKAGSSLHWKEDTNAAAHSSQSNLEVPLRTSENQVSEELSNSLWKTVLGEALHREVRWIDTGQKNLSLDSIQQHFQLYLLDFLSFPNTFPLRCIRAKAANVRQHLWHRCLAYLREEIALTSEVARCAIISHEYPSPGKICPVCGYLCGVPDTRWAFFWQRKWWVRRLTSIQVLYTGR